MRPISVLMVEGEALRPQLIDGAFAAAEEPFAITYARSAADALAAVRAADFQVAFLDSHLNGDLGLDLLGDIRRERPGLPIIVTADRGSEPLAAAVFNRGAADLIIKSPNYHNLLPGAAFAAHMRAHIEARAGARCPSSPDRIYDSILEAAADLLNIHSSSIMLFNDETGFLDTVSHRGLSQNYVVGARPRRGESLEGLAVAEGRPCRSGDLLRDPLYGFKEPARLEGLNSVLSIPFRIESNHDVILAVVNLYSHRPDGFKKTDERLASHLVKLSSLALETLNLYYHEHHIAQTLQRSHFPDIECRFDDWEVAHRYKVSMEEALLGGDFYDLFKVSEGRRAIVVADVSGKGINAATQTAMIKYTLRSYAIEDPDPASVLKRTNEAFHALSRTDHFVTLFYALIDPRKQSLSYCSAGHPPPLFFSNRLDRILHLTEGHLPIGVWDDGAYATSTIAFTPGDTLLVYTDGLTDCRRDGRPYGELFGQTNLEKLYADCAGAAAEEVADSIIDRVLKFSRGKMKDDVAFFVIRLLENDRSPDTNFSPAAR